MIELMLAQEGGDSMVKIIVGVLFAVFWIIAQIAGSLGKKKEEAERRQRMEQIARETEAREREEALRGGAPPPLPPVMVPSGGGVNTREEMERRMAEARERRQSGRGVGPPPVQQGQAARRDQVFQDPVARDMGGVTNPADPMEELRRRQEEERQRQEAIIREQRRRTELDAQRRKAKEEKARRAAERQAEAEAEEQAARAAPSLASERAVYQETFAQATNRPRAAVTTVTESRGRTERAQGADAAAIRKWLTPATLRQQYILTELLSPPIALRPDREW